MEFRCLGKPWLWSLALAGGVLLTACGSQSGSALPVGPTDSSVAGQAVDPGVGSSADDPVQSAGSSTFDQSRTVALDMMVRVANTYIPDGSQSGAPIEVWVGTPGGTGKKLTTVAYGTVSEYFAPQVSDPLGQGVTDVRSPYNLSIFPVGAKSGDDLLIDQGEDASPGQKLTMVVGPNAPGSKGASMSVSADDIGSSPKAGGFTFVSLPKAPAGKAVLQLGAYALQGRAGMTDSAHGLTPSTADGRCLPYFDLDTGGIGLTNTLHDMSSDTIALVGGTQALTYAVPPGLPIRVNQLKDQETVSSACKDTPVFGPVDPQLKAGERAYGVLYGPSLSAAKLLVIPVS